MTHIVSSALCAYENSRDLIAIANFKGMRFHDPLAHSYSGKLRFASQGLSEA
ncbi:hypothetical protein [Metallosphaera hakonensis]|uniref:hypothetical protein n=1 Tax=Metallosphaera hakonensis TaxID=79601 RepID=UPI000B22B730|nr:hypothetical protein [Metallosphaera hakonensis]